MVQLHIIATLMLSLATLFGALPTKTPQSFAATAGKSARVARTSPVQVGEIAPDFTLEDVQGRNVTLSAARGKMPVVLVFYRGYWCPYCAHQLGELRSLLKPKERAKLYAISIDSHVKSKDFAAKIAADKRGAIAFPLLSDPGFRTIDAYGLHDAAYDGKEFEGIPHAAVYVIDKQGRVRYAQVSNDYKKRPTNKDIRAALDAVK